MIVPGLLCHSDVLHTCAPTLESGSSIRPASEVSEALMLHWRVTTVSHNKACVSACENCWNCKKGSKKEGIWQGICLWS